ncbi:hypothetical protein VULLAG_LOCUS12398 [Vulpes lagopus]
MRNTERGRDQAEGEAGSMQGARRGTQSRASRVTPWAEGPSLRWTWHLETMHAGPTALCPDGQGCPAPHLGQEGVPEHQQTSSLWAPCPTRLSGVPTGAS